MGNARLVLPNGLSMSGNDQITIAPGGSLKMFCDGTSCTVGGNGVINQAATPRNFMLECTPNVKTFTFNGNGEFIGVLVAPEADMTMNGGGKSNNDFIGSLMMNSVGMNGHFSFHYDEALGRMNTTPACSITPGTRFRKREHCQGGGSTLPNSRRAARVVGARVNSRGLHLPVNPLCWMAFLIRAVSIASILIAMESSGSSTEKSRLPAMWTVVALDSIFDELDIVAVDDDFSTLIDAV